MCAFLCVLGQYFCCGGRKREEEEEERVALTSTPAQFSNPAAGGNGNGNGNGNESKDFFEMEDALAPVDGTLPITVGPKRKQRTPGTPWWQRGIRFMAKPENQKSEFVLKRMQILFVCEFVCLFAYFFLSFFLFVSFFLSV